MDVLIVKTYLMFDIVYYSSYTEHAQIKGEQESGSPLT